MPFVVNTNNIAHDTRTPTPIKQTYYMISVILCFYEKKSLLQNIQYPKHVIDFIVERLRSH